MARAKVIRIIANQVFIGCPWKNVRPKYERIIEEMKKKYPTSFIIIGREREHHAEDLLDLIKKKLITSSKAIFDATNGNPNVSLEFGYAEGRSIESSLYLCTFGKTGGRGAVASIISDLAGKRRKEYKNETTLTKLMKEFCAEHPYTKLFEKLMRSSIIGRDRHKKKRFRALSLKIIHRLDDVPELRRDDLITDVAHNVNPQYDVDEVEECVKKLHAAKLISVSKGRYSTVSIR